MVFSGLSQTLLNPTIFNNRVNLGNPTQKVILFPLMHGSGVVFFLCLYLEGKIQKMLVERRNTTEGIKTLKMKAKSY